MEPKRQREESSASRGHAGQQAREQSPGIRIPDYQYRALVRANASHGNPTQGNSTAYPVNAISRESLPSSSGLQAGRTPTHTTARDRHSGPSSSLTRHSSTPSQRQSSGFAQPAASSYAPQPRAPWTPTAAGPALSDNTIIAASFQATAYTSSTPTSRAETSSEIGNRPGIAPSVFQSAPGDDFTKSRSLALQAIEYDSLPRPPSYPSSPAAYTAGIGSAAPFNVQPRRYRMYSPDLSEQQVEESTIFLWSEVKNTVRPSRYAASRTSQANANERAVPILPYKGNLKPGDRAVLECSGTERFTDSSGIKRSYMVIEQKGRRSAKDDQRSRHRWLRSEPTDYYPEWADIETRTKKELFCCMGAYDPTKTAYQVKFFPSRSISQREKA